jgi:predicted small lipoprotein YifL
MRQAIFGWDRWIRRGLLAAALSVLAGCGPSGPKYYPVTGKVVMESDGSVPAKLIKQTVEFQSTTEPNTRAFGEIKADGSFELSTWREGRGTLGAIEGTHKGRMLLEIPQEEEAPNARKRKGPIEFKYTRFETSPWTIQVPPTGEVILKVQ